MKLHHFILKEILVSLLAGSVPSFVAYKIGGTTSLDKLIKALLPNTEAMVYWIVLTLSFLLFTYISWRFIFHNENAEKLVKFIASVLNEVGNGIHSFLRAFTGTIFALLVLWGTAEPQTLTIERGGYLFLFCCVTLSESICFSFMHSWIRKEWRLDRI